MKNIHEKTIDAIRVLSIEAVEKAKSGHPGLPLGAAAIGYELYANHLNFHPQRERFDRDRFVLSAGHGTALLYSLLHLFGSDISISDLQSFRQMGSKTPGHPERGITPGVDVSTGPLGQGIANAVGLAMAETILAARFNRDGFNVIDHYTYALCGEGCLMEGIGYEAASLAGTWNLGKLILLYDCNKITIEGSSDIAFDEDIAGTHAAMGWQILRVENGNDPWEIGKAIENAKAEKNKPSLIIIKTAIGYSSPKEGMAGAHGAPLGSENVKKTKEKLGWNSPDFSVPSEVYAHCAHTNIRREKYFQNRDDLYESYSQKYPELYKELINLMYDNQLNLASLNPLHNNQSAQNSKEETKPRYNIPGEKPRCDENCRDTCPSKCIGADCLNHKLVRAFYNQAVKEFSGKIAIRKAGNMLLNQAAKLNPLFLGGSADLGPSNLTLTDNTGDYSKNDHSGRNIHFGIREHAMAAICNGLALSGLKPYCSTFFSFSDYMKNAIRMSAIMNLDVLYIFTHDSIAVGEDGPTHQPIEHLAGLRAMPNLKVFRPADAKETAAAFAFALNLNNRAKNPTAIVESKQDLPLLEQSGLDALRGGYIIYQGRQDAAVDIILLSAGSEVALCINSAKKLLEQGINARVISMPCMSLFDAQSEEYKEKILPKSLRARVAVEAGSMMSWGKYVGLDGGYVCIDHFGESAPASDLFEKYNITEENIIKVAKTVIQR